MSQIYDTSYEFPGFWYLLALSFLYHLSMLMDEYLTQENLRLLDTITAGPASSSAAPSLSSALAIIGEDKAAELKETAINRNRAILQMCLHMEGLAKFARVCHFFFFMKFEIVRKFGYKLKLLYFLLSITAP